MTPTLRRIVSRVSAGVAALALAGAAATGAAATGATGAAAAGSQPASSAPTPPPGVSAERVTNGVDTKDIAQLASYSPTGSYTATWKYADALKVWPDATTTTPLIPTSFPTIAPSVWQWDTWPLTNLNTTPVTYKGWHVIFSLVADRSKVSFGDRHWVARWGFFYSKDGRSWKYGGQLFPEGWGRGCMEWAGSAIITGENTVKAFYTTVGPDVRSSACPTSPPYDTHQKLALSEGQIHADANGVWFTGFRSHRVLAAPDGVTYQTIEQGPGSAFRDPFVFRNPADQKIYAVFEGNTGGVDGVYQCKPRDLGPLPPTPGLSGGVTPPPEASYADGNIGLMMATDGTLRNWKVLKPILSANCVNEQTERPHFVFKNGLAYLFTISHRFTYAPGLNGPDGVYGFVGPSIRSDFQPLNGSALVLGNPPTAPEQNYSHEVLPNLMVQSFIDQIPNGDGTNTPGGTLAPTLQIALSGANSYLTRVLPYGYIPATWEWVR